MRHPGSKVRMRLRLLPWRMLHVGDFKGSSEFSAAEEVRPKHMYRTRFTEPWNSGKSCRLEKNSDSLFTPKFLNNRQVGKNFLDRGVKFTICTILAGQGAYLQVAGGPSDLASALQHTPKGHRSSRRFPHEEGFTALIFVVFSRDRRALGISAGPVNARAAGRPRP